MQSRRSAIGFLGLIVIAFVIGLLALPHEYSGAKRPVAFWIEQDYMSRKTPPAIVVFGDSQLGGLRSADAKVVGRKLDFATDHRSYLLEKLLTQGGISPTTFVASQPGSLLSDYFVMSKALFRSKHKPAVVVITVTPRAFLNNGMAYPGDSDYFRFFSQHADLGNIVELAYPSFSNKVSSIVKDALHAPAITEVEPGQFLFLPADAQKYKEGALPYPANFTFNTKSCQHQMRFLHEELKFLAANNIQAVIVAMPTIDSKEIGQFRKLSATLCAQVSNECAANHAGFLDLTDDARFSTEDFLDPVHLSQHGGEKFANILSQYVTDKCVRDRIQVQQIN